MTGTVVFLCVLALVLAFVAACVIAWAIYRRAPGGRWCAIAAWNAIDTPIICADCNGMGIISFGQRKIGESPGEIAHAVWARGNNRTCSQCLGRGYVTSAWKKPVLPALADPDEGAP